MKALKILDRGEKVSDKTEFLVTRVIGMFRCNYLISHQLFIVAGHLLVCSFTHFMGTFVLSPFIDMFIWEKVWTVLPLYNIILLVIAPSAFFDETLFHSIDKKVKGEIQDENL